MSLDSSYFMTSTSQNQNILPQQNVGQNNISTSISHMDELVKEYLLFRGFTSTFKSFEHDLKQDKDRCFRADKITDMLLSYIHSYDLNGLLEFWSYLDNKYFSRITLKISSYNTSALSRKYELFLLRYYLVYALQTSKTDKALELFENYASKLQSQIEWKEWYCLPFLKNPEENQTFSIYFSKNWIDTFIVSLQNFLNIVFQSVQFPRLLNYEEDAFWNKLSNQRNQMNMINQNNFYNFEQEYLQNEIIDEFQLLHSDSQNRQGNTLINMIKNFTNSSKTKPQNQKTNALPSNSSNDLIANKPFNPKSNNLIDYMNRNKPIPGNMKTTKSDEKIKDSVSPPIIQNEIAKPDNNSNSTISALINRNIALPSISDSNDEKNIEKPNNQNLDKPTVVQQVTNPSLSSNSDPYLTLSQDDYKEHKSAILHCKFSNDGKYIASVDVEGLIKIWSIENSLNTVSTLMQKISILTIEWDKRNANILYLGTKSSLIKIYDVIQKKITQELSLKSYPLVTSICSISSSAKVFIFTTSKTGLDKNDANIRNGQLTICDSNAKNFTLTIEKMIDLEAFFCQSATFYKPNFILIGCSDGNIKIYDFIKQVFCFSEKCHNGSIVNLRTNKTETILISLSNSSIKVWNVQANGSSLKLNINQEISFVDKIQIPVLTFEQLIPNGLNDLADLKISTSSNLVSFDSSENYLFLLDKLGAYLDNLNMTCLTNRVNLEIEKNNLFNLDNSTTLEIWNASHLCILLIGSSNGILRIFKLLHQY